MRRSPTIWTEEMDRRLTEMWPKHSSQQIAEAMNLTDSIVLYRAEEKLRLPPRSKGCRNEPPDNAWLNAARFYADQEGVDAYLVLSGHRTPDAVIARRKAIAHVLRQFPRVTYGGLARVSGLDRDTVRIAAARSGVRSNLQAAE